MGCNLREQRLLWRVLVFRNCHKGALNCRQGNFKLTLNPAEFIRAAEINLDLHCGNYDRKGNATQLKINTKKRNRITAASRQAAIYRVKWKWVTISVELKHYA